MIMLSFILSIIALIFGVLSLVFLLQVKLYYLNKMDGLNERLTAIEKADPYEKYRNVDGLLSKKVIKERGK